MLWTVIFHLPAPLWQRLCAFRQPRKKAGTDRRDIVIKIIGRMVKPRPRSLPDEQIGTGPRFVHVRKIFSPHFARRAGVHRSLSTGGRVSLEGRGASVDAEIVGRLPSAEGKMHPLLLELVGRRRIDALPAPGSLEPSHA